jgi:hypothetical protein
MGWLKPSRKSSISASPSAWAAWPMSIIMARWKCATAPATAFRRWNVSRRRAVAQAQPQCLADSRSSLRREVCDPGHGGDRVIGRGARLTVRAFRLPARTHPRQSPMPSRSLPRSARGLRPRLQAAPSPTASWLPQGAFGLVPSLHDDRPRISVPMTALRTHSSVSATPGGRYPFTPSPRALRPLRCPMQPRPDPRRRLILTHLELAAGQSRPPSTAWATEPATPFLSPCVTASASPPM